MNSTLSVPSDCCQLTTRVACSNGNIQQLDLSGLQLTGNIPDFSPLTGLLWLNLDTNFLTGPLPPFFGTMQSLVHIDAGNNRLSGPLLPSMGNQVQLQGLYLNNNFLSGSIPKEFVNLRKLEDLTGPLPESWSQLQIIAGNCPQGLISAGADKYCCNLGNLCSVKNGTRPRNCGSEILCAPTVVETAPASEGLNGGIIATIVVAVVVFIVLVVGIVYMVRKMKQNKHYGTYTPPVNDDAQMRYLQEFGGSQVHHPSLSPEQMHQLQHKHTSIISQSSYSVNQQPQYGQQLVSQPTIVSVQQGQPYFGLASPPLEHSRRASTVNTVVNPQTRQDDVQLFLPGTGYMPEHK
ncbi:hypothetical protein EDD86DRAFT_249030 [Gorgonomyces haynaldii]|nr:hypothetical protein EDD86DRAFT_249030 [Gorgonomyces haynaldii]